MEENFENKGSKKQSSNLWLGLIFVLGGIALIINQLPLLSFKLNWWALFIMLPATGMLNGAYNRFRANDNLFTTDIGITALIGLFMVGLSFSLLVGKSWNLNWSLLWPAIIILIDLGIIFGRSQRGENFHLAQAIQ